MVYGMVCSVPAAVTTGGAGAWLACPQRAVAGSSAGVLTGGEEEGRGTCEKGGAAGEERGRGTCEKEEQAGRREVEAHARREEQAGRRQAGAHVRREEQAGRREWV
jgi:hypothetical protein